MSLFLGGTESATTFVTLALLQGGLFGFFMALILGTMHRRATRGSDQAGGVRAEQIVVVPVSPRDGFRLCTEATGALAKAQLVEAEEGNKTVEFKVGRSMKSWGERVKLTVLEDGQKTSIAITSRSAARLTVIDSGKNRDNVDRLIRWLERHTESTPKNSAA